MHEGTGGARPRRPHLSRLLPAMRRDPLPGFQLYAAAGSRWLSTSGRSHRQRPQAIERRKGRVVDEQSRGGSGLSGANCPSRLLPAVLPRLAGQCREWLEVGRQVPQCLWTTAGPTPGVREVEVNLNAVTLGQVDRSLELIV